MAQLAHITDETFESEISSSTPTLVDFWAEWCGPCRMVAPVLEQIQAEQGDKLRIVKMNVDEEVNTPQRFHVQGIPTMILFKEGRMIERIVGFKPKPQTMAQLQPHLGVAQPADARA